MELALKKKIKIKVEEVSKFWIKMILKGKTELHKTTTVKSGVKMVLVMELTKEMELLTSTKIIMELKMRLSMAHVILMKIIDLIDILKNMIAMKLLIRTKLKKTATTKVTESEM